MTASNIGSPASEGLSHDPREPAAFLDARIVEDERRAETITALEEIGSALEPALSSARVRAEATAKRRLLEIHPAAADKVPGPVWTAAVEPGGEMRDGTRGAEITGDCLKGWPKGMRLTVRKEPAAPGAQLRTADADGLRLTFFATNTPRADRG